MLLDERLQIVLNRRLEILHELQARLLRDDGVEGGKRVRKVLCPGMSARDLRCLCIDQF